MGMNPRPAMSSEILEKVRERDPEALGMLFDHHYNRIFNLAYRLVGERSGAEDVAQDVFLRVYRAAHQLDPQRDPGPWLMTITTNLCREQWRSKVGKQAKQTTSLDAKPALAETLQDSRAGSDARTLRANRNQLLATAISTLPDAMREVVVLHDLQGLSHEEVSGILGEEASAVRKRYSRALKKLRELLPEGLV